MEMENEQLSQLRHSAAHLLAATVEAIYPEAKRTLGPPIDTGFYYDFDNLKITDHDLTAIENKMRELVKGWTEFSRQEVSKAEALEAFKTNEYKQELINEFAGEGSQLTFYTCGGFTDLCRGGHTENPSKELKHFKLLSVAGAYWRGNEKNKMLTRIYGTAFFTKEELEAYLHQIEEAKKRDHRKLGQELDLFVFSELVGPGLPLFTPRGTIIRDELGGYSQELQKAAGYQRVAIPHITKVDLYKTSGHYDKYPERFNVSSVESDSEFMMKPMNCPHHTQIFASRGRSYRDLPIRYMENTVVYRDEKAGELHGLSRVRAATQDDAHVFCRIDQIEAEFKAIMQMIKTMYDVFGLKWRARLSFRDDSDKYLGDPELWNKAQTTIENVAKELGLDYFIGLGEAAFYGPKIDIMATDAIGREWQLATEQLDFVQPERFGLEYTAEDGTKQRPVMIHKALLGSLERFMSVYIEHVAGSFPTWLAPVQVLLAPVSGEKHAPGAEALATKWREAGIRVEVDAANETIGKKVRNAAAMKVPYIIVLGDRELAGEELSVRVRGSETPVTISAEKFVEQILEQIKTRSAEVKL